MLSPCTRAHDIAPLITGQIVSICSSSRSPYGRPSIERANMAELVSITISFVSRPAVIKVKHAHDC